MAQEGVLDRGQLVSVQPQRADARTIREAPVRIVGQDAASAGHPRLGDQVIGELGAVPLAPDGCREWVEDRLGGSRKVTGTHCSRRHFDEPVRVRILGRPLVAYEEKGLVLLNRAAYRASGLVVDELRLRVRAVAEVGVGRLVLVVVVPECGAVDFVGAALDLEVYRGSSREALIGVERSCSHVHDLDRLESRVDASHVR